MTDREVAEINVLRAIVRQADAIAILETQLAAMTAERNALQADKQLIDQAMDNLPGNIKRLVLTEYGRLKHKEMTK